MTRRDQLVGLVALLLALAGCGSTEATAPSVAASPEQSVTGGAPPQQGSPPAAAAETPCGDAVRDQVQETLGLESVPTPESAWAQNRHTCTYQTPMGPVVLSVSVEATDAAAQDHLETLRAELRATDPVSGRPEAYKNGRGVVVAHMDNLVLSVDASALPPEHLGPEHQTETGVAIILATGVLNGWTGQT